MIPERSLRMAEIPDDLNLRPETLEQFIGQTVLKERLRVSVDAALHRGEVLDHVLFSGPPGLGKTTLAAIIAREMRSNLHSTSAPAITKPGDLARMLTLLEKGDVLFIDEIHRLNRQCEEILYPAMEDGVIDLVLGEGVAARSVKIHLKPFTLVGATTRSGMLSAPLKNRFGLDLKLDFYETEDLSLILKRTAQVLALKLDDDATLEIAHRARMTPREANRLLRRIRDYATVEQVETIHSDFVQDCLQRMGIDTKGLNELDRKVLRLMIERYGGGPVGLKTLAALVDEEDRTLEEDHEPFMLRLGLIEKSPQGRRVTRAAYDHFGIQYSSTDLFS
ncbi:MAG TPA: Holliday junction branch migration DNA helicase RuvB [Leptospiraceae bacterium]|nr:Holliday junction branch migration DNA helicase RuvB [Spirochaetaceae bacterium]HBS03774.1 Holliday junction branch migration DNA helicase RuvB [Leptospiraceae bacterium]|tara:strand:+ start:2522 stop:3526 length:1005 start_codon:yes stop_codon:yes gene_type:complete